MPRPSDKAAFAHLAACDVIGAIVEADGPLDEEARRRGRPKEAYGALVRAIVGQQLSTKAAATINGRLLDCLLYTSPSPRDRS